MNFRDLYPHVSVPPAQPVDWICGLRFAGEESTLFVRAQSAYAARLEAARILGCEPDQVWVQRA